MDRRPAGFPTPAASGIEHDAIRLIIATRVALYREGLAEALDAKPRIAVVGTAASSRELDAAVLEVASDAVLLDTELDDAIVTAGRLVARRPDLKIVALRPFTDEIDVIAWAEAGVSAFVTQMDGLDRVVAALEGVVEDRVVCPPLIAAALLRRVKAAADPLPSVAPAPLTLRELDVLKLVDEGLSNKEIAVRLGIKLATVKNHVHNILGKLDVGRRAAQPEGPDPDPGQAPADGAGVPAPRDDRDPDHGRPAVSPVVVRRPAPAIDLSLLRFRVETNPDGPAIDLVWDVPEQWRGRSAPSLTIVRRERRFPGRGRRGVVAVNAGPTDLADGRTDIVYLDIFEREVNSVEDPFLVNAAIGIETSVRTKREIVLRVAEGTATLPGPPAGHQLLPLALLRRTAGAAVIDPTTIQDIKPYGYGGTRRLAVAPAFTAMNAGSPGSPWPSWAIVGFYATSKVRAVKPVSAGDAWGVVPVSLPDGVNLRRLRLRGRRSTSLSFSLDRDPHDPAGTSEKLVETTLPQVGITPFDVDLAIAQDGRQIVDGATYSYVVHAWAVGLNLEAEIHGISITYDP